MIPRWVLGVFALTLTANQLLAFTQTTSLFGGQTSSLASERAASLAEELTDSPNVQSVEKLPQPRLQASYLGLGGVVIKDDYLSPMSYGGFNLGLSRESLRKRYPRHGVLGQLWGRKSPKGETEGTTWLSHRLTSVDLSLTENPARNASIYRIQARWDYARLYRLVSSDWGTLRIGPGYTLGVGGLYSSRNGNNPITFKADASLGLSVHYTHRLRLMDFPIGLKAQLRADLVGLQWSQHFGESYYEMLFLRQTVMQRLQLVHLANQQSFQLRLGVDLPLFRGADLSLLYRMQYRNWRVNDLPNRQVDHGMYVGLVRYIHGVSGSRRLPQRHYF